MTAARPIETPLPPGQCARTDFPRFGVSAFANFEAPASTDYSIQITGDIEPVTVTSAEFTALERFEQTCDFHCVTTWS